MGEEESGKQGVRVLGSDEIQQIVRTVRESLIVNKLGACHIPNLTQTESARIEAAIMKDNTNYITKREPEISRDGSIPTDGYFVHVNMEYNSQ